MAPWVLSGVRMSAFSDVWVSPGDLIELVLGGDVEAYDFRDLNVGGLVSVNSYLLRPEKVACVVVERLGSEFLDCGKEPIRLTKYIVRCI